MTLKLRNPAEALSLYGQNDENLKLLRSKLRAKVVARGDELRLTGDEHAVAEAATTFTNLLNVIRGGSEVSRAEIEFGDFMSSAVVPDYRSGAAGGAVTAAGRDAGTVAVVDGPLTHGPIAGGAIAHEHRTRETHADATRARETLAEETLAREGELPVSDPLPGDEGDVPRLPGRSKPKTHNQRRYVQAIAASPITFGLGPAGTGKTYLAVAMAVEALLANKVKRIVLTRPAVEAGEKLGFLPGDLQAKIDPYLRPLYDALFDMLPAERAERLMEQGTIEVAPLAFMRGRTLNDSFIILDEAQNTTGEQMKMFLTRMGFNSKVVVTGDTTQTDLPGSVRSGLTVAHAILQGIEGIRFITFSKADVVRHPLVAQIILAYEQLG